MGRKPVSGNRRRRKLAFRDPYDEVLIVCEGEKTEPLYLGRLVDELRLNTANVEITSGGGSDPRSIVNTAKDLATRDSSFDRVYCVFDRDKHAGFFEALSMIKEPGRKLRGKIFAIVSHPCFEYWLLLHFENTARGYSATAQRSTCNCCIRDLRSHLPAYAKGEAAFFTDTYPLMQTAIERSEIRLKAAVECNSMDPSTNVHELVIYLRELKT